MADTVLKTRLLAHVGLVVADLETAADDFERRWGVRVEDVTELTYAAASYSGRQTEISILQGFIRSETTDIELIEPVSIVSPFTDFLINRRGDGLHHLAYVVDSIDEHLARLRPTRADLLLEAHLPDDAGRIVQVDGFARGTIIELIELSRPEGLDD